MKKVSFFLNSLKIGHLITEFEHSQLLCRHGSAAQSAIENRHQSQREALQRDFSIE
ncbi:hypothetical protein DESC_40099 [Desulfosarcina cetonica]|nr:hypothetical protein DESC_40099 [Desulfosarcina cetonica]